MPGLLKRRNTSGIWVEDRIDVQNVLISGSAYPLTTGILIDQNGERPAFGLDTLDQKGTVGIGIGPHKRSAFPSFAADKTRPNRYYSGQTGILRPPIPNRRSSTNTHNLRFIVTGYDLIRYSI